ncbi:MAG: SMP-30/gluconolactonase/LRE family protein, partial [Anaerolineaceae bacterium]|nr:SMP-30/gluconolactonase/LRE family protein [Anaerolineaceae bacterium]
MTNGFEVFDERFKALLLPDSRLQHLADGCIWAEGPVWLPDDSVVWSDIPNNRMLRWSAARGVETFRQPSNFSNGNTLDRQGRLVTCEHGGRRVSRTETDGSVVTLADRYQGGRFNSPNDLVVRPDDSIWFTDPPYGILPGTEEGHENAFEQDGCHVYRLDPASGAITRVIDDMVKPNGLAFSPDG